MRICPECELEQKREDARFCFGCGFKLPPPPSGEASKAELTGADLDIDFADLLNMDDLDELLIDLPGPECTTCGAVVDVEAAFCPACGTFRTDTGESLALDDAIAELEEDVFRGFDEGPPMLPIQAATPVEQRSAPTPAAAATPAVDISALFKVTPSATPNQALGRLIPPEQVALFQGLQTQEYIGLALFHEVSQTLSANTLFRTDSVATKVCINYLKYAESHLKWTSELLVPILQEMSSKTEGFEVDESKLPPGEDLSKNIANINLWTQQAVDRIFKLGLSVPFSIQSLLMHVRATTETKYPGLGPHAVGAIFFLRWICPWLSAPEAFGHPPGDVKNRRPLLLVAKILNKLANGVRFKGSKESYMEPFDDLLNKNDENLKNYLTTISMIPPELQASLAGTPSIAVDAIPARLTALLPQINRTTNSPASSTAPAPAAPAPAKAGGKRNDRMKRRTAEFKDLFPKLKKRDKNKKGDVPDSLSKFQCFLQCKLASDKNSMNIDDLLEVYNTFLEEGAPTAISNAAQFRAPLLTAIKRGLGAQEALRPLLTYLESDPEIKARLGPTPPKFAPPTVVATITQPVSAPASPASAPPAQSSPASVPASSPAVKSPALAPAPAGSPKRPSVGIHSRSRSDGVALVKAQVAPPPPPASVQPEVSDKVQKLLDWLNSTLEELAFAYSELAANLTRPGLSQPELVIAAKKVGSLKKLISDVKNTLRDGGLFTEPKILLEKGSTLTSVSLFLIEEHRLVLRQASTVLAQTKEVKLAMGLALPLREMRKLLFES